MAKLEVKNLTISFRTNNGAVRAVRDISFDLNEGETLAIAGESGSGKSVTTRAIMGILAGNAMVDNGEIIYDGKDLLKISEEDFHTLRGHKLAMIFQDPLSALNPIMRIGKQLTEAMILNNKERRRDGKVLFNKTLENLEKNMVAAQVEAGGSEAEVKPAVQHRIREFDQFVSVGVKMEEAYLNAQESAVEAVDCMDEIALALIRKDEKEVNEIFARLLHAADRAYDPYLISREDSAYAATVEKARKAGTKFTMDRADALKEALDEWKQKLTAAIEQETPNFFRIGYCAYKDIRFDPSRESVQAINEKALKELDQGFMNDFLPSVAQAIAYSDRQSRKEMENAIVSLQAEAPVFRKDHLDQKECIAAADRAAAAVEKAIDPLALEKDNLSYVFESSMHANIDRYFYGQKQNPREEKRFEKDTAKREKLLKQKKAAAAVVPKNLVNVEAAHQNLQSIVAQLTAHYQEKLSDGREIDASGRAYDMMDYLKNRASESAYELSMGMAKHRAIELMKEVGIPEPHKRYHQYPFEFSGGMRQRIVIAIALSANPDILICDEPTTALDVTIQAQILELINRLKVERKLSVIFITHDLGVVANMADRIAIMYAGKIVEYGTADDVFYDPRHPYTWALLSSMPDLETKEKLEAIPGTPPNMILPPQGDAFAARNKYALQIDFEQQPPMFRVSDTHQAATWLLHPDAPKVQPPAIVLERIQRMKRNQAAAQTENTEGGARA